eukprot:snap_masked-scaffold_1-processed-gene-15.14-mRNA-1 protein AED:1.00 eAED:1.00 QI:0/0/0/0/1/1/2/0/348
MSKTNNSGNFIPDYKKQTKRNIEKKRAKMKPAQDIVILAVEKTVQNEQKSVPKLIVWCLSLLALVVILTLLSLAPSRNENKLDFNEICANENSTRTLELLKEKIRVENYSALILKTSGISSFSEYQFQCNYNLAQTNKTKKFVIDVDEPLFFFGDVFSASDGTQTGPWMDSITQIEIRSNGNQIRFIREVFHSEFDSSFIQFIVDDVDDIFFGPGFANQGKKVKILKGNENNNIDIGDVLIAFRNWSLPSLILKGFDTFSIVQIEGYLNETLEDLEIIQAEKSPFPFEYFHTFPNLKAFFFGPINILPEYSLQFTFPAVETISFEASSRLTIPDNFLQYFPSIKKFSV